MAWAAIQDGVLVAFKNLDIYIQTNLFSFNYLKKKPPKFGEPILCPSLCGTATNIFLDFSFHWVWL
jgi:hypothetical protein